MKYLVFGNGYFGQKFSELLPSVVISTADITDEAAVREAIRLHAPSVVINAAGKTGRPNVDWCEDHKEVTLEANARGPLTLLKVCQELDQYWVQLGSGCIYQGDHEGKGWSEEDAPTFTCSYYSKTKAWMNDMLADFPALQVRLRMPLDAHPGPRNLITKLATYTKVISAPNSISVVDDVVFAIAQLSEMRKTGIYNLVNPGIVTHKEILDLHREYVDASHAAEFISLEELSHITKAPRSNCVLSTEKLAREGVVIPEIHVRLEEILRDYKNNLTLGSL